MNSFQIKPIVANSNQTLKIVRRWNDVQRRNKFRISNIHTMNETTSDCADENSVFCPDDTSPPRSNESRTSSDMKDDESTIIRSKMDIHLNIQLNYSMTIHKLKLNIHLKNVNIQKSKISIRIFKKFIQRHLNEYEFEYIQ